MLNNRTAPRIAVSRSFAVLDVSRAELASLLVQRMEDAQSGLTPAYALHVGGLSASGDTRYTDKLRRTEIVYADGASVVLLARLRGARRIQRAPTTDLGLAVLRSFKERTRRPARVALVGGPAGLAIDAGATLGRLTDANIVAVEHGFHDTWDAVLERLRESRPDLLFVGLGSPREVNWVEEFRAQLPSCVAITCGGWFGFLAGRERRAPWWLQKVGLEWAYRVLGSPRRLAPRYTRGAWVTGCLTLRAVWSRIAGLARQAE